MANPQSNARPSDAVEMEGPKSALRTCANCHVSLENLHRGRKYCSRLCQRRDFQQKNREYFRAANKASYERHREARLASRNTEEKKAERKAFQKAYRAKRPDIVAACEKRRAPKKNEYMAEYRARPEVIARTKQYNRDHRKELHALHKQWKKANPKRWRELTTANMRIRRQRLGKAFRLTRAIRLEIMTAAGFKCAICGVATPLDLARTYEPNEPTIDHIMPLKLGGAHARENLQLACRQCNDRKGSRHPGELVHLAGGATPNSKVQS